MDIEGSAAAQLDHVSQKQVDAPEEASTAAAIPETCNMFVDFAGQPGSTACVIFSHSFRARYAIGWERSNHARCQDVLSAHPHLDL